MVSDKVTSTATYTDEQVSWLVQDEVSDYEYINFYDSELIGPDHPFSEENDECDERGDQYKIVVLLVNV